MTILGCLQDSDTPSPAKHHAQHADVARSCPASESPALVSACGDLVAQTGAMLIDDPCIRFNSPGPTHSAHASNKILDRLQGQQHPASCQGCTPEPALTASSGPAAETSSISMIQPAQPPFSHTASCPLSQQGPAASFPNFQHCAPGMFTDWRLDRCSPWPEAMSLSCDFSQRPGSALPYQLQPEAGRFATSSRPYSAQLPLMSGHSYKAQNQASWDLTHPASAVSNPVCSVPARSGYSSSYRALGFGFGDHASAVHNMAFLPPVLMQGGAQQTAMQQLAQSPSATANLLACMAANTSQATPAPGSDLIMAASSTIQAFALAAQSTHDAALAQQIAHGDGRLLLTNSAEHGQMPEQQQHQQMAHFRQWQQLIGCQQMLPNWTPHGQT